jgi:hypothetical protein
LPETHCPHSTKTLKIDYLISSLKEKSVRTPKLFKVELDQGYPLVSSLQKVLTSVGLVSKSPNIY